MSNFGKSISQEDVADVLEAYSRIFQEDGVSSVIDFVKNEQDSIHRSNMRGHITASGLVLRGQELLLVFHKKLQRFIQPGGHLEKEDLSLQAAAQREVQEETGLVVTPSSLFHHGIPLHVDAHMIPANPRKNESEHWHYDCMYLFSPQNDALVVNELEIESCQWVPLDYQFNDKGLGSAAKKIKRLLKIGTF